MTPRSRICAERLEQRLDDDRREPERRLVEQQHVGPRDQRARDRELLLLAARERARVAVRELGDHREEPAHPVEVVGDALRASGARRARAAGSRRRSARRRCGGPRGRARRPARAMSSGRPRSALPARAGSRPPASGTTPMIACSVVDLPAPFGPIRPTISPRSSLQARARARRRRRRSAPRRRAARAPPQASTASTCEVPAPRYAVATSKLRADLVRRPLGERAAAVEHVDAVADLHDQRDVVVDQQHAGAEVVADGADDGREGRDLGLVQPGRRLVHQHEARLRARARARRRAGARRRAAAPTRGCVGPGREAEQLEQLVGAPARLAPARRRRRARRPRRSRARVSPRNSRPCWNVRASPARPRRCGGQRVISRRAELDPPRRRQVEAGEQVDERRLAGAVRADQPEHLVGRELEVDVLRAPGSPRTSARRRGPGASQALHRRARPDP